MNGEHLRQLTRDVEDVLGLGASNVVGHFALDPVIVESSIHTLNEEVGLRLTRDDLATDRPDVGERLPAGVGVRRAAELDGVALQELVALPVGRQAHVGRVVDLESGKRKRQKKKLV